MSQINIYQVSFENLSSFFSAFDFTKESLHIQQYISFVQEASFCYQNVIHKLYDKTNNETIGFTALSTTKDVDDIPGILIEFLYLKPKYRGKTDKLTQTKYSYLLLDYIISIALKIQKQIAINHVYLVPINNKVRKIYNQYGFENIPSSKSFELEDYMVFNLLEEDPTIL